MRTDAEAWDLVAEHLYMIPKIVRRLRPWNTVDRDELEGAAVEKLFKAAKVWDPAKGAAFTSFAYLAITRAVIDEGDRQRKWLDRESSYDPTASPWYFGKAEWAESTVFDRAGAVDDPAFEEVEEHLDLSVDVPALRAAIEQLPPRRRQVIYLLLSGLTDTEISRLLGLHQKTVTGHKWMAYKQIRELMSA